MRTTGPALKVGLTAILVAIVGYVAFKFVAKGIRSDEGYEVWALFHDATGLVDKSRVQIAGLVVGDIRGRKLQGNLAAVTIRVKPDVELWSNAVIFKKSASLLGEFYLEIDPGTPLSPAADGRGHPNYKLNGCVEATGDPDCNRIKNVIEAVTTADVLTQMNDTLPVLREILKDVQKITAGPMQDIAVEVRAGVRNNSAAAQQLLEHLDEIAQDVRTITTPNGVVYDDLKKSLANVREITEGVKQLIGTGEGQVNSAGDKFKQNLDKLAITLDKLNHQLDQVGEVTGKVARGEGTIGKLLTDDAIANNVTEITEDAANFTRSLFRLQTIVGIREEYGITDNSFKTYVSLRLMPRPDKYYLLEFIDDPRGSRNYNHTYTNISGADGQNPTVVNTDTWVRTPAFRFSFMFAKRVELWKTLGITGRIGIKESTGGLGVDFDLWKQRLVLAIDAFDFAISNSQLPRLKVMAAIEVIKHAWIVGGVDDILNGANSPNKGPPGISCGPGTPSGWCVGGRDYFVGAQLTFNDEDLRALLAIGGAALAGGR